MGITNYTTCVKKQFWEWFFVFSYCGNKPVFVLLGKHSKPDEMVSDENLTRSSLPNVMNIKV